MRLLLSLFFVVSLNAHAAEEVVESLQETQGPAVAVKVDKVKAQALNESEIPLNLEKGKKASSEDNGLFRILFTLSILGLVGGGAYFFLKKYSIPQAKQNQTQIKVLQQHYLGPKKSLAIVRVAGESILIGVTDHNISMIKSLSLLDDEVPEEAPQTFNKVLGGLTSSSTAEVTESTRKVSKELDADDEFAISGIKDIVSKRLKGMRSIQ